MSVRVEPGAGAGRAVIRVGGAAGAAGAPGFQIQREDYDDNTLGPLGWQGSDAVLAPDRAEASGPDLLLHVGWAVCQHLEAGVYLFALPGAGLGPEAVFWPDIAPLHAGAVDVLSPAAAATPEPPVAEPPVLAKPRPSAPAPVPVVEAPPPPPPPPLVAPNPARSRAPLFGLLALLLLLAAGGAAWWKYRQTPPVTEAQVQPPPAQVTPSPTPPAPTPPTPPVTPPTPPEPSPPTPPLQLGSLSVPDVIARAPNPAAIAAEGARRLGADRHDDGLLLLEAAADRGDGGASAALGKLYDPVLFQPGGAIPRPDPRQAARYYRDATRAGADVSAAREALKHSLEAKAQSGDLSANLTLKDFWP